MLVRSDRTDKFLELCLIQIFYSSVVHPRDMCNTRNRSIWRIRLVVKWTIKKMNTIELHYICICWIFIELLKWRKLGIYWTRRFIFRTFFYITNLYEIRCCKDLVKNNMIKHLSQKIILHWALLMWFWEDFRFFFICNVKYCWYFACFKRKYLPSVIDVCQAWDTLWWNILKNILLTNEIFPFIYISFHVVSVDVQFW